MANVGVIESSVPIRIPHLQHLLQRKTQVIVTKLCNESTRDIEPLLWEHLTKSNEEMR